MSRLKNLARREAGSRRSRADTRSARAAGSQPSSGPSWTRSTARWSSSTRPAASRSRRRGSRRQPGTCRGCTSRSRMPPRSPAGSRPRSERSAAATRLPEEEPRGRRLRRRRRHLRHRPPGAVGRARARSPLPVRLLRQRGVHEHGHPALGRDAVRRVDDDQPVGSRESRQGAAAQGHDRDRDRAPRPTSRRPAGSHWQDLSEKVERAAAADGPAFLNVLTNCPLGWGHEPRIGISSLDAAVESCFWPLYEVVDGRYRLTYEPESSPDRASGCGRRPGSHICFRPGERRSCQRSSGRWKATGRRCAAAARQELRHERPAGDKGHARRNGEGADG